MIVKKHGTSDDVYSEFYVNSHIDRRYSAYIRGRRCMTSDGFFKEYSAAFQFPAYFGENWNAWDECACDLDWLVFSSIAIIIDQYDQMFSLEEQSNIAKSIFEEYLKKVSEYWENENNIPCNIIIFTDKH